MSRGHRWSAFLLAGMLVGGVLAGCASPAPTPRDTLAPVSPEAVASRITAAGLAADLDGLAAIASANGGTRGTGSAGDLASAAYVEAALAAMGYEPWSDTVPTSVFTDPGGSEVAITGGPTFDDPAHVLPLLFSPADEVEGPVVDLGWDPGSRAPDGPGCDAADFAGLPAGAIVLSRPGPCYRRQVLEHAQSAGAGALVTAAPWTGPGEIRRSTLLEPAGLTIPAIAVSRDVAAALAAASARGGRARVIATGASRDAELRSVLAERPGADPTRVVMVGAHLDSSLDGPGLNDDGSGVAAVLAIARALADTSPGVTIRVAFWAAEETGLHGSTHYVQALPAAERDRIVAYLNVDMIASPNGIAEVYDEAGAAPGSTAIRDRIVAALDAAGIQWEPGDLGGAADHAPFAAAGVPTGGVFTGASEPLTPQQAERSGRRAGVPADACYHLACDDRSNVDEGLLLAITRALARTTAELAASGGPG
jgi:hypothetical protein